MDKLIESGAIVIGGVMNRFKNDHAVRVFCEAENLSAPSIDTDGSVWAYTDQEEIQIGWTF